MTARRSKTQSTPFRQLLPYFFFSLIILTTIFRGSLYKNHSIASQPIMHSIGQSDFTISTDRISEMYLTADLAYTMNLATRNYINMDYISVTTQYAIDQTGAVKLEKPNIVDVSNISRGVREYVVSDNENLDAIAAKFKVTTDQIRWSNGLRTAQVAVGQKLLIPTTPGIIYTVKEGDTFELVATKYGSPASHIIAYNDLETADSLTVGARILLPGGSLPTNERPENQRIQTSPANSNFAASQPVYRVYHPVAGGNPLPYGWCTWYAWQWRKENMPWNYTLPGSGLGDARYWDENLRNRYYIDRTPKYGSVFQNDHGYYGHVGIVTGVNSDGSITISDMNGVAGWGRVGSTTVPKDKWINWDFIHQAIGT